MNCPPKVRENIVEKLFKLTDAFGLNAMTDSLMDQACLGNTSITSTLQKKINTYVKVLNTTVNNMLETDT